MKRIVDTALAPPPAGAYAQAVEASGTFLYISGQTARLPDGTRLTDRSFEDQARQAMENVQALATAAGYDLASGCVQITTYLRDLDDRVVFDRVLAEYVGESLPARALVQSNLVGTDLQVQAVLVR